MGEIYGKENQEICFQNKRDPKIKKDYWSFVNQNLLFKEIEWIDWIEDWLTYPFSTTNHSNLLTKHNVWL